MASKQTRLTAMNANFNSDNNKNDSDSKGFQLQSFFPYQVRIFYLAISQSVSDIYFSRYGLSVSEWRTMAVLGNHQPLTASDVVERSSIDKVQVSRAIQGLLKRELLERNPDADDRRRVNLQLTPKGQRIFEDLIPRVRAREQQLLNCLDQQEQETLVKLMKKVRLNAEQINLEAESASVAEKDSKEQAKKAL